MTAQQVTEELKVNARKEAEITVAEAHLEGEQVIRDASDRRLQLVSEIQDLKRQKITFEAGLRSMIEGHLKLLDMDILQIEEDERHATLLEQPQLDSSIDEKTDIS